MFFADVHKWLDQFEIEVCKKRKKIRGRTFTGFHLEIYDEKDVVIVMEPGIEGTTPEDRAKSFVKDIFDDRVLEAFIPYDRFEKIVKGEDEIREDDWLWNDEQF